MVSIAVAMVHVIAMVAGGGVLLCRGWCIAVCRGWCIAVCRCCGAMRR